MTYENPHLEAINEACFENILALIYQLTGITVGKNRKSMVLGRLRKRVLTLQLASYESYYEKVKSDSQEQIVFIDLVTTNETYFYRTSRIWDYVSEKLLQQWYSENSGRTFYAWSAAASSGEEAHTLGVLLQAFKDKNPEFQFQIIATDISSEMIQACKQGIYEGRSIESFKKARPDLFTKYLKEVAPGQFSVTTEIKSRIRFQQHNLFQKFVFSAAFDLVLLRNVLIYFTPRDQEQVISLIFPVLHEKGVLIIGESESLSHIQTNFQQVEPLVYKKNLITQRVA